MNKGELWRMCYPEENWLWFHLLGIDPIVGDIVVLLDIGGIPEGVRFQSLSTGNRELMVRDDFVRSYCKLGDTNEEHRRSS